MNTDTALSRQLALAAHELRAQMPPATLLPAIHRQLRGGRWKVRTLRARGLSWLGWGGLSTAAVLLATLIVASAVADSEPTLSEAASEGDGFVRLVGADAWQRAQAQQGSTWLVSAEVPQARLAALGLPYDPARAGERIPAELLIHSSGEVLAVRVNSPEEKP